MKTNLSNNKKYWQNQEAFTFAEVLAAMVFMAILIPIVLEGISIANKAGIASSRQNTASFMGNNLMNELVLNNQWQSAGGSGDFGPEYPGYSWQLSQEAWPEDVMVVLHLDVIYPVQGQTRGLRLSTLIDENAVTE